MDVLKVSIDEAAEMVSNDITCYIHRTTREAVIIPEDLGCLEEEDRPAYESIMNSPDYIEVRDMPSRDSFRIMADFVAQLPDARHQAELERVLQGRKPFANFRWHIDDSDFREEWFAFRDARRREWFRQAVKWRLGEE